MKRTISPHSLIEVVFNVAYLVFAIISGVVMICVGGDGILMLFGALTLILGVGDSFHLLPRIYGRITSKMDSLTKILGAGKLVTSITMTIFYLILYVIWVNLYGMEIASVLSVIMVFLAVVRIILSLMPQNKWLEKSPPLNWGIYRNIPFLLMGIIIMIIYSFTSWREGDIFKFLPIAVGLSFLFYLPVVIFAQRYPKVGGLMLPKTLAYVWIIIMGFGLM